VSSREPLLGDLDLVFVSYDEPAADVFYERLITYWPRRPHRVHGVKGFHAAHREAAKLATTERFLTVDGDAWPWDDLPERPAPIEPMELYPDAVISYGARNKINGLIYGNGGVKIWPRRLLLSVPTHEEATTLEAETDFCNVYRYWQSSQAAADTIINDTPYQAFRAGYREGIKLTLARGLRPASWDASSIAQSNLSRLRIWCSVGADHPNGIWAIWGARRGFSDLWITESVTANRVNDYDWLQHHWNTTDKPHGFDAAIREDALRLGEHMEPLLGPLPVLDDATSAWHRNTYLNWPRRGLIFPDMEAPTGW